MPIVATVTRTGGGVRSFSQGPSNVADQGGVGYSLRKADGQALGMYQSVGAAQAAFSSFHGRTRIHGWQRRDLPGSVEQWVCIGTPLDPKDIWQLSPPNNQVPNAQPTTALIQWIEPSAVFGSVKLSTVGSGNVVGTVSSVKDISGGTQYNYASSGDLTLREGLAFAQGRRVLSFDGTGDQLTAATAPNPTAPATIVIAANMTNPGADGILVRQADQPWSLLSNNGEWQLNVGGLTVTRVGAISATDFDIVTIVAKEASTELRVNGESIGSVAAPIDLVRDVITIGGPAPTWEGNVGFFMMTSGNDLTKIKQTERYVDSRYRPVGASSSPAPPPFSPADMATPPVAWYESSLGDLSTDLSGNGYDLAGVAPTYVAAAPSGALVARFDGTSQYLRDAFLLNQDYYVVAVGVLSRVGSGNRFLLDGATGNQTGAIRSIISGVSNPDPTIVMLAGAFLYPDGLGGAAKDLTEWRRFEALFNGASSEALITGTGAGSATGNAGTNNPGGITIGANGAATAASFADADVGAVLLFDTKPSADDLTALRAYLDGKYGT